MKAIRLISSFPDFCRVILIGFFLMGNQFTGFAGYDKVLDLKTYYQADSLLFALENHLNTSPDSVIYYLSRINYDEIPNLDISYKAAAFRLLGNAWLNISVLDSAMACYHKAWALSKSINDTCNLLRLHNNIGLVFELCGHYDLAQTHYHKALSMIEAKRTKNALGDECKKIRLNLLNNLGVCYDVLNEPDSALRYHYLCLSEATKTKNELVLVSALLNIGVIYKTQQKYDQSAEYLIKAKILADSAVSQHLKANTRIALASLLAETGDYFQAKDHYESGLHLAEKLNAAKLIKSSAEGLAALSEKTGDFESALFYRKKFHVLKDSIFSFKVLQNIETFREITLTLNERKGKLTTDSCYKRLIALMQKNRFWLLMLTVILSATLVYIILSKRERAEMPGVQSDAQISGAPSTTPPKDVEFNSREETEAQAKYRASNLKDKDKIELIECIESIMLEKKPWLKEGFTITELANMAQTSRTYLSQAINEKFNKSFSVWINDYRIEEAIRLISGSEKEKYSIEAIATMVGFSSKSSFYKAFREVTGTTPAEFLKKRTTS